MDSEAPGRSACLIPGAGTLVLWLLNATMNDDGVVSTLVQ